MKNLLNSVIHWGTRDTQTFEEQRKLKITNAIIILAAFSLVIISVFDYINELPALTWVNILFFVGFLTLLGLNKMGYHQLTIYLLLFMAAGLTFFYSSLYGVENGAYLFYFIIIICIPFIVDVKEKLQMYSSLLFMLASLFVSLNFSFPWQIALPADVLKEAFIGNVIQVGVLTILFVLAINWSNNDVNGRIKRAMKQVETMLEYTSYFIWSVDKELNLVQANTSFKKLLAHRFGIDPKSGTPILEFIKPELQQFWKEKYELGLAGQHQEFIANFEFHDGAVLTLEISLFAVKDEFGESTGVTVYGNNVTDKLQIAAALRENRELLTDALELARLGTWRSDLVKNEIFWDERCAQIFGVDSKHRSLRPADYFARIHPDDLAEIRDKIQKFEKTGGEILLDHRIITPLGELKFVHEKATGRLNEAGELEEIKGIIQDVTEVRKQQELEDKANHMLAEIKEATETLLVDSDFQHAFEQAVDRASKAIGANYAWVFKHMETEFGPAAKLVTPLAMGRINDNDRLILERGLTYKKIGFEHWYRRLSAGETIQGQIAELPEHEQKVFKLFDIRSLLALPIFVDNTFWGFVGFDNFKQDKKWRGLEEHILRGFCNALGGAISQQMSHRLLKEAKEAAENASQIKSNFLSNISHEIRTPMNAIIGLTELLIPDETDSQKMEYLQAVRFSADNLLRLINDLLDLSKIEADKLELNHENFKLKEQLFQFEKTLGYIAKEKKLKISLELADNVPDWVQGDNIRLNQILLNLGSNAIKFTPKGQINIRVRCISTTPEHQIIQFEVADSGIGITNDKVNRIFDRFEQAEKYTSRQFGGTGLGLTITKKLVDLMGGEIIVSSELNVGSTFIVELPFAITKDELVDNLASNYLSVPNLNSAQVLLVEDHPVNILLASRLLKQWGANFEVAENGFEAVELLKHKNFDLILLDIQMPLMNGFELIEKIRSSEIRAEIKSIPVIALTADAFEDTRIKAIELGFDDFITKPIKSADLYQKMSRLLA